MKKLQQDFLEEVKSFQKSINYNHSLEGLLSDRN